MECIEKPTKQFFRELYNKYYESPDTVRGLADFYGVSKSFVFATLKGDFDSMTGKRTVLIRSLSFRYEIPVNIPIILAAKILNGYLVENENGVLYKEDLQNDKSDNDDGPEIRIVELKHLHA